MRVVFQMHLEHFILSYFMYILLTFTGSIFWYIHFWRSQRSWRNNCDWALKPCSVREFPSRNKTKREKKELDSSCTKKNKKTSPIQKISDIQESQGAIPTPRWNASGGRLGEWFSRWLYWNPQLPKFPGVPGKNPCGIQLPGVNMFHFPKWNALGPTSKHVNISERRWILNMYWALVWK